MRNNSTLILFFMFVFAFSQNENKHTCTSPEVHRGSESEIRAFNKLNKNSVMKAGGVEAWVESIHSFAATWKTGGYDSFSIGTGSVPNGPNRNNIRYGQGLWNTAKTIYGFSYEELRQEALNNPLGPKIFNLGEDFYLHLYNGTIDDVFGPFQFNWEDLGNSSNSISVTVETQFGINGVGPFTAAQQAKILDFYNKAIPIIESVYGPPSLNQAINVVNDGYSVGKNTFYNGPNWITSSYFVNATNDLDQPRLLLHELLHAWRDNVTISSNNLWHYDPTLSGFEEGMAEAVAVIVMDKFIEQYPTYFNDPRFNIRWGAEPGYAFDWDYDFQNHQQISGTDFWSSDQGTGVHWERYGTASAAFYKMYIEDNDVFKKFNAQYYAQLNNNHSLIPSRAMVVDILSQILPKVEEEDTQTWINNQRIFDCIVTPGKKIHMLSFQGADGVRFMGHDNRLQVIETQNLPGGNEWSWDVYSGGSLTERWYHQMNNLNGNITINKYDGSLYATRAISNNYDTYGVLNGNSGPHQGPCTPPNINGPGPCFPTGISQYDFYTTSADPAITNGGINDGTWYTNQGAKSARNFYKIQERGLYTYNIVFNDQGQQILGKYYRLHGDDFISTDGIYAGVINNNDTPVTGRMYVEQKDDTVAPPADEEPAITIINGTMISSRIWGSIPETDVVRQAGRSDRRYSKAGKVHAIYISEDPTASDPSILTDNSQKKIAFRNIAYGARLSGVQMFLFNVDEFKDIVFTILGGDFACEGDMVTLSVENNFPNYLDTDTRITYQWLDPQGTVVSNTKDYTIAALNASNAGLYELHISFFGNAKPTIITKMVDMGSKRWNGSVDNAWDNPLNWTPNTAIPNNMDCVVVPPTTNDPLISGNGYIGYAGTLSVLNGATLLVKSGNTIAVTDKVSVETGGIFDLEDTSSLVQINDVINSGNIIYRRNTSLRQLDYTFWSSPVLGYTVDNISNPLVFGPIYLWNTTFSNPNGGQGYWLNASGQTMEIARGYITRAPNSFNNTIASTLFGKFNGIPNNGTINFTISRGNDTNQNAHFGNNGIQITHLNDNLNLVGNPYPSAIRASQFLFNNSSKILGNVRIWRHQTLPSSQIQNPFYGTYGSNYNPNDYLTYNFMGANCCPALSGDLLIGAGQGFFVEMLDGPAATDLLTFTNDLRSANYDNSLFFKNGNSFENWERHRIWIDLTNTVTEQYDRTLLGYIETATNGEDSFFDSMLVPSENTMTIYSSIGFHNYTIQGRALPFDDNDEVPLGINLITSGNYSIGIGAVDGIFGNQEVFLKDELLGIVHNIKISPYYFNSEAGIIKDRFKVIYKNQILETENFDLDNEVIVATGNELEIISKNYELKNITIFDVIGRKLANYKHVNALSTILVGFTKTNGTLILGIELDNGLVVKRKIVF